MALDPRPTKTPEPFSIQYGQRLYGPYRFSSKRAPKSIPDTVIASPATIKPYRLWL
jgi:hypothetical protein